MNFNIYISDALLPILVILLFVLRFILAILTNLKYFKYGPEEDSLTYYFWSLFYLEKYTNGIDKRSIISTSKNNLSSWYLKFSIILLGKKILLKYSWLPNFILFFIIYILAFLFLSYFNFDNLFIFKFFLFFTLQHNSVSFNDKNIHYLSYSPRFMYLLINSIYWFIILYFNYNTQIVLLLIILGYLSISSTLFSRQVFIIISIFYSIFSLDFIPLIIVILSILLYLFINKIDFITKFHNHFLHLKGYYIRNLKYSKTKSKFGPFSFKNPFYSKILIQGSFNLIIVLFSIYTSQNFKITIFFIVLLFLYFIFAFKKFSFLGESYRYAEYASFLIFPFTFASNNSTTCFILLLILILKKIFTSSPTAKQYFKNFQILVKDNIQEYRNAVWYSINYRMCQIPLSINCGEKGFTINFSDLSPDKEKKYFAKYPYLKWSNDFFNEHNVTHILIYKPLLEEAKSIIDFIIYDNIVLINENSHFAIYKYNKPSVVS